MPETDTDDGLPPDDGEDEFNAAADHLGQLVTADPTAVSDSDKLAFYGLYKQATMGDCTAPRPLKFWDVGGTAKW
jgi:acyl-CoA-binding protein